MVETRKSLYLTMLSKYRKKAKCFIEYLHLLAVAMYGRHGPTRNLALLEFVFVVLKHFMSSKSLTK